jgi:hypothetical protein
MVPTRPLLLGYLVQSFCRHHLQCYSRPEVGVPITTFAQLGVNSCTAGPSDVQQLLVVYGCGKQCTGAGSSVTCIAGHWPTVANYVLLESVFRWPDHLEGAVTAHTHIPYERRGCIYKWPGQRTLLIAALFELVQLATSARLAAKAGG